MASRGISQLRVYLFLVGSVRRTATSRCFPTTSYLRAIIPHSEAYCYQYYLAQKGDPPGEMGSTLPERPYSSPVNGSLVTLSLDGASLMAQAMGTPRKRRLNEVDGSREDSKYPGIPFYRRPAKKKRRSSNYQHRKPIFPSHVPQPCPLTLPGLPFELIAHICWYLHPRDVLSLTRTNAWLCYTLIDPSSAFIWRIARKENCWGTGNETYSWEGQPSGPFEPMPDLPSSIGISEPTYAALVFDDGPCDVS